MRIRRRLGDLGDCRSDTAIIAGRVAQGIGAAPLLALSLAITSDAFPDSQQARAIGIWTAVSSIALAIGPLFGGLLVELDWRLIFWVNHDGVLLEYPPALHDGVLYMADKAGEIRALRASTGDTIWTRSGQGTKNGAPDDTTGPAYAHNRVFVAMQRGEVLALDPSTGKVVWDKRLPTQLESSPLVIRDTLYIGSDKGIVFALDTANGKTRWSYKASAAAVKTSPSFVDGKVFFADYGGVVHAVDARAAGKVWQHDTDGEAGGSGGFYSSPALAAGKLYIGRDDGAFFALDQDSGKLVWSKQTGAPIIGSPALAKVPGTPLSVYIGNYDGALFAFEAVDGRQRWRYRVGGAIPGTPTVVGTTVYTSSFRTQEADGVDAKTGRRVWRFAAPGYTPMISDGVHLYLTGYESLRALEPK